MFKACPRLPLALLALALSLSAAAAARAQVHARQSGPEAAALFTGRIHFGGGDAATDPRRDGGRATQRQDANASGTRQQQQQQQQQQPPQSQQQGTNQPAPLTAGQKVERSFRAAFLRPAPYIMSAFTAGITQLREDRLPHKDNGDEVADWGSRAARSFATRATTTLFASGFYAALFKQDPRYEPSQSKNVGRRTLHAVSRVFVTRDDDWNLEPNYSRFAGVMTASALANVWEHSTPGHDRVGTDATLRRFARSFATGALSNIIFKEFGPDIIGIFRR